MVWVGERRQAKEDLQPARVGIGTRGFEVGWGSKSVNYFPRKCGEETKCDAAPRVQSDGIRIPPRGCSFVTRDGSGLTASCSCRDGMRLIGCAGGPSAGDKCETARAIDGLCDRGWISQWSRREVEEDVGGAESKISRSEAGGSRRRLYIDVGTIVEGTVGRRAVGGCFSGWRGVVSVGGGEWRRPGSRASPLGDREQKGRID
jgi:hypothetical protein